VRFTPKGDALYAFLLGAPKGNSLTIKDLTLSPGGTVALLGASGTLAWTQSGKGLQLQLPSTLPGNYAYALKITAAH
jgi:alpha-L-fucosidase